MSKVGKLKRGLKWSLQLQNEGSPEAKAISEDPAKMNDVNFYEEFINTRQKKKVDSLLMYMRKLERDGLKGKTQYRQTVAALESDEIKDQEKIKAIEEKRKESESKSTRKK